MLLRFRGEIPYGSCEHFYHFALGYLFPAMAEMVRLGLDRSYQMHDCGPRMTPLIAEAAALIGADVTVVPRADVPPEAPSVPRWDFDMLSPELLAPPPSAHPKFHKLVETLQAGCGDEFPRLADPDHLPRLRADLLAFRQMIWDALDPNPHDSAGQYLILEREASPAFYKPGGGAETQGYGTDRRALTNVPEVVAQLQAKGVAARAFAPGPEPLAVQMRAFRDCAGVAMIRGAEVAHMLFMRPGRPLFVIAPKEFASFPAPHDAMSRLLGVPTDTQRHKDSQIAASAFSVAAGLLRAVAKVQC